MVFMGSKAKYCKYIVPIINKYIKENNIEKFYDCFCGGANLADKIECKEIICNDLSPTLIALHQQVQKEKDIVPPNGTREWWDKAYTKYKHLLRNFNPNDWNKETKLPLAFIGAIEWYGSFSNGGFARGYAKPSYNRNYYNEAYRNHQRQADNPTYQKIQFIQGSYNELNIEPNTLIYCDSPYKSTKPYQINSKFNFEEYYNWLREKSKTNPIFISEQTMPEDFLIVWEMEAKRTAGKDNNFKAIEKLYFIDNRN